MKRDAGRNRTTLTVEDLEARIVPADTVVRFDHFNTTSGLVLNGSAESKAGTGSGKVLRLADAVGGDGGSAFSQTRVNASKFSTFFAFRITNPGGVTDDFGQPGADGIAFVVQPVSSSIGGIGAGIGYAGIAKSVAVEFDTFGNNGVSFEANHDPSSNHVGITTGGNPDHGAGSAFAKAVAPDFDNGNVWFAWVDYNGTTLEVRVQTGSDARPAEPTLTRQLNLPSILGQSTAFIGFTAATGLAWGDHDILKWEYRSDFSPITSTPEVTVIGNGLPVADNDQTPAATDHTDFGAVNAGTPVVRTFTVRNTGQAPLNTFGLKVPAGFTVTEGLLSTIPAGGQDTFTVRLDAAAGGTFAGEVAFSNTDPDENPYNFAVRGVVQAANATISGRVYNDANGNGARDAAEAGLGLFVVFLDTNANGVADANEPTVTTRIYGNYSFGGLAAGTYRVRVVPVANLAFTSPAGGLITRALTAGQTSTNNLFGVRATG